MPTIRTRARDADRDALCTALDAAFAEGQLDGAEHRERTAAALRARTLGELHRLAEDLQLGSPMPQRITEARPKRVRRQARWIGALASLALVAAGFAIGRATAPEGAATADSPGGGTEQVGARVVGLTGLHTTQGWTQLVADVRERLGTTRVAEATVYPEYAVITTPLPGQPGRAQAYQYRGGLGAPSPAGTRSSDEPLVDLAAFDPTVVMPLVAGAPQSLGLAEVSSTYLIVEDGDDGPAVSVYASNDFHESGYLKARPDGSIIAVYPNRPG